MSALFIDNATARRLWIERNGLASSPLGTRTLDAAERIVTDLGMVQLDPIRTVARAHEHILWSRCTGCRPPAFERLIERRHVFEHFSHDAVILPMALWPHWQRQRRRRGEAYERGAWGQSMPPRNVRRELLRRIEREGPLCSRDLDPRPVARKRARPGSDGDDGPARANGTTAAWSKPAHKIALDGLWLDGTLAVSHRRGFLKHYDLAERVIPSALLDARVDDATQIDHLCRSALARLGVASATELKRFWDAMTIAEARTWIDDHRDELVDVEIESADGGRTSAIAPRDIEARLSTLPEPGTRLRVVNPFDPLVRDRERLTRLFGFDFRIEIYVPPAKRRFGYYVFPLLEGTRFVGRAELKADRENHRLDVPGLWWEPGVRDGAGRRARLAAELTRFARLADATVVGPLPR